MIYIILLLKIEKNNEEQKEIVDDQYENDYINFNDIVPNQYIGIKNNNELLR